MTDSSNLLAKSYRCAARGVEFMDVVSFADVDAVFGVRIHEHGQFFVDGKHYVHADAEVGGGEQGAFLFVAEVGDVVIVGIPTCGAAYDGDAELNAQTEVGRGSFRCCEFNGDVGRGEKVFLLFHLVGIVYCAHNRVTFFEGERLDCMAHFAVSYESDFHDLYRGSKWFKMLEK